MPSSVDRASHSVDIRLPDRADQMAKADSRIPDPWRAAVGQAVERARNLAGLSLKEFARDVKRDERQVARWISGDDRVQLDAILAVPHLRQFMAIAVAEISELEVEITLRARRRA